VSERWRASEGLSEHKLFARKDVQGMEKDEKLVIGISRII